MAQRFIQLSDVSEILDISSTQAYALVRSGELAAIKVGGRGQWRVEATELENYIQRMKRCAMRAAPWARRRSWLTVYHKGTSRMNVHSRLMIGALALRSLSLRCVVDEMRPW